ncbi:nucleolar protein 3 isoform X2 [Ochotona princeps]|uniref:nucleolar protein 3 isoform X2 n=1 Tax=Ochotona princeps TaxID=9978 RepID=UPI002714B892|nr:nucleolar protein 3 isoform X2 [Ochotona princeps]
MGNAQERPSQTIDRERKRLVETLQADSGLLLDALLARGVLTGPEYEALDALPDAERRMRRLLLVVQSKGEAACLELLRCAQQTTRAPDPAWDWQHATGTAATIPHAQATGRLRPLGLAPYAQGCPQLRWTTMRLGVLRDLRLRSPGPQRSQKWKGLNRIWNQNQNRSLSQNCNPSQNQNRNLSQSQSPTSRRQRSPKIPEGQSFEPPFPAVAHAVGEPGIRGVLLGRLAY